MLLLATFVLPLAGMLPAQVPPACQCTQTNAVYTPNTHIGTASTTASCSALTFGATVVCRVSGTITLNYAPSAFFTLTQASYADPSTAFTPAAGVNTFTHPVPTDATCDQGGVRSEVYVAGTLSIPPGGAFLLLSYQWSCDSF